jgi:hypothetical protein
MDKVPNDSSLFYYASMICSEIKKLEDDLKLVAENMLLTKNIIRHKDALSFSERINNLIYLNNNYIDCVFLNEKEG